MSPVIGFAWKAAAGGGGGASFTDSFTEGADNPPTTYVDGTSLVGTAAYYLKDYGFPADITTLDGEATFSGAAGTAFEGLGAIYGGQTLAPAQMAEVVLGSGVSTFSTDGNSRIGLWLRYADTDNWYRIWAYYDTGSVRVRLGYNSTASGFADVFVGNTGAAWTSGHKLKAEIRDNATSGVDIDIFFDSGAGYVQIGTTQNITVVDVAGGDAGIYMRGNNTEIPTIQSFTCEDL